MKIIRKKTEEKFNLSGQSKPQGAAHLAGLSKSEGKIKQTIGWRLKQIFSLFSFLLSFNKFLCLYMQVANAASLWKSRI